MEQQLVTLLNGGCLLNLSYIQWISQASEARREPQSVHPSKKAQVPPKVLSVIFFTMLISHYKTHQVGTVRIQS